MTISNSIRTAGPFFGNGIGKTFPFTFKVFSRADLLVSVTDLATGSETVLILDADYSVFVNADQTNSPGGYITKNSALAVGYMLAMTSNIANVQNLDLTNNGGFYPEQINGALDRIVVMIQQLAARGQGQLNIGAAALLQTLSKLSGSSGATMIGRGAGTVDDSLTAIESNILETTGAASDQISTVATMLYAGTAATVDCFGDSTMWGADPANLAAQVAIAPPAALQNFVGLYYGNAALTVNNRGLGGTTAAQMIAGTDGSGSTFAAKMAASGASVVYCNHGINDATGTSATTADVYKAALVAFVRTVRKYGKTPVLVTPLPSASFGMFGSVARSERIKYFAQVVRDVAAEYGVALVDNARFLEKMLASGKYKPLTLQPDAVHPAQALYLRIGYNLALPLVGQLLPMHAPEQFIHASAGCVLATEQQVSASTASRVGAVVTTGSTGAQSMRALVYIDEPGLDLYMAHPMFESGNPAVTVQIDGAPIGTISMNSLTFAASGSGYIQDQELMIAQNLDPGLHVVHMSVAGGGGMGIFYFRTRETDLSMFRINGSTIASKRKQIVAQVALESVASNTVVLLDEAPTSRLLDGEELEFTAQMQTDSGFCLNSFTYGTNGGIGLAHQGVVLAFNGAGAAYIYEATGPGSFSSTLLSSAVNYTLTSHTYRVVMTAAGTGANGCGTVRVFVDGAQIGGTVDLTKPYYGGYLGIWKNQANGILAINNLVRISRI